MHTDEIREKYLTFFEGHGCVRRPSDVLVPKGDPTVLFTPAGMNQFKEQFLGIGIDFTRATTCQKCLRTGDIANVGVTAYHHTFFEMLGNFSFGDYFKKEAVHWAWEFLTGKQWMALDPERLSVSVYRGAHGFDEEALKIWRDEVGVPEKRIAQLEEDENFWPASAPSQGPDGVCGPCSEIFYHPPEGGKEVEIWNLVFTQFNRVGDPPDNLRPLPKKNIDTGMGLERMASVMQGVRSNFETDALRPICTAAGEVVGQKYEFDAPQGRPLRRIADHVRAITFAVHEGVAPGNKEEAYVVRLLLRRAFLEGYLLGMREPFLHQVVPAVVAAMAKPYPELKSTLDNVVGTVREEEQQFLGTIDRGLHKFERLVEKAMSSGQKTLPGGEVFDLHQTDGFILDLTKSLAYDRGLSVDLDGFNKAEQRHKSVSGKSSWGVMAAGPLDALQQQVGETEFLGYDATEAEAVVVGLLVDGKPADSVSDPDAQVDLVLNRTPFYGESGGQVGDVGTVKSPRGEFEVLDTQKHAGLFVHRGRLLKGELKTGETVQAEVLNDRRAGIRRAHSATHLLHHALHTVLGEHAMQRGSKVEDDVLRFDFSHGAAVTADELRRVEDIVNERVEQGAPVTTKFMDIKEARAAGATALFGEKYPDRVRVVTMGDFSRELCGGTHLANTGQVGLCKLVVEESVSSGVRRITALTGRKALERVRETEALLRQLVQLLKTPQPEDLPRRVEQLQNELRDAKRELAKATSQSLAGTVDELLASAEQVGGAKIVTHVAQDVTREALRDFVDQLRQKGGPVAILIGAEIDGKAALIAAVSKELIARGVKAGDAVKAAAPLVGGGGGGRPDMAEAGGKNPAKLPDAVEAARKFYREKLA